MARIYYDDDATLEPIRDARVGIVGYGIQGRAQALNLRDSGLAVRVGNRDDGYVSQAVEDGFNVATITDVAASSDVLLLLIPDQAHRTVYEEALRDHLPEGALLVVAHGYSVRFGELEPRADLDVAMLAPRMPGRPIREYFLRGHGVPAFVDVRQDATGTAWDRVLALAKGMGFTRAGALAVSTDQEAEIDLFIEQFLVPRVIRLIEVGFEGLEAAGYDPLPAVAELYASGELGEVLLRAAVDGLYGTFEKNASPTCQFGIADNYDRALSVATKAEAMEVIEDIRSGRFAEALSKEGESGYPATRGFWAERRDGSLARSHADLQRALRLPGPA